MLKYKISKSAFEALTEAEQKLYKAKGDDFILQVEGLDTDDNEALKRAKDREVEMRKEAVRKNKELQEQLDELTGNDAKKRGDIATLEASWKAKLEAQQTADAAKIKTKDDFIRKTLIDNEALRLATKLCGDKATLMLPHVKARLQADLDGEVPVTKILDATGKVSVATLDDLEKEFVANKDFAAILVASKASGSGAPKDKQQMQGNGGAPLNADGKQKSMVEMSIKEKVSYLKAQKEQNENN